MIDPETFLDFVKQRRSIRNFQEKMIKDREIEMILEAGRWSPSASNKQPWQFIVIKNKEIIKILASLSIYGNFVKEAPVIIAIVGKVSENPNWYIQDTSLASMQMMLMAWALNIGTCWIGSMDREKAKEILNLGREVFLLTILPLGYFKKNPKPTMRKRLNEITRHIS